MKIAQLQGTPWHYENRKKTCKEGSKYCLYNHNICSCKVSIHYHKKCVGKGVCDDFESRGETAIAADVRNIQILPVSWILNTSAPYRHKPFFSKCKPPGVCLRYVLALHTLPEQTVGDSTTQQENTQHNKQYSNLWPPEYKKFISFWPSHQTS